MFYAIVYALHFSGVYSIIIKHVIIVIIIIIIIIRLLLQ